MSNLVEHARRELELIKEDADVIEWYVKVIKAFASFGHSGGSASATIPVLNELLQFKNLSPLTTNPDEWYYHDPEMGVPGDSLWQNKRNSEAFSLDGGKTYYLLSEGANITYPYPIHKSKQWPAPAMYNVQGDSK